MANTSPKGDQAATDAVFGSMVGMTQSWIDAMGSLSGEVMTFVAARLQEDAKTQQAMLQCKDLKDMQHIQAQFFQKAIEQYQEETGKLVEMGSNLFATEPDKP